MERPLGLGAGTHLDEEVAHAQPGTPCHTALVHRLQVLQGREGRGGGELLDGGLRCRWEEPAGSEGRGGGGEAEQGMGLRPKSQRLRLWLRDQHPGGWGCGRAGVPPPPPPSLPGIP